MVERASRGKLLRNLGLAGLVLSSSLAGGLVDRKIVNSSQPKEYDNPPITVTLSELLNNPDEYQDKQITVTGFSVFVGAGSHSPTPGETVQVTQGFRLYEQKVDPNGINRADTPGRYLDIDLNYWVRDYPKDPSLDAFDYGDPKHPVPLKEELGIDEKTVSITGQFEVDLPPLTDNGRNLSNPDLRAKTIEVDRRIRANDSVTPVK